MALLEEHFKSKPIAAGRCIKTNSKFWYVKGKRVVMKSAGTQTANGTKQYLVTVE
ncbi:hypothetical protein ACPD0N_003165 [Vibrio cholerae]